MEPKYKSTIFIGLTESGQVMVRSDSQNFCTIFGMLELAKKAYIEAGLKPKSNIEEVHGVLVK